MEMNSVALYVPTQIEKNRFLGKTYLWMAFALLLSGVAAFFTVTNPTVLRMVFGSRNGGFPMGFGILLAAEFALVFFLSLRIRSMSVPAAAITFIIYSIVNGMTLASIFFTFSVHSIAYCFAASVIMFGVMAVFGATTKKNLASWGYYLTMSLTGCIFAILFQVIFGAIFHQNLRLLDIVINIALVVIFSGLTAWDNQKLMKVAENAGDSESYQKFAIYAALQLYLDFINIFLSLLRIFGRSRR